MRKARNTTKILFADDHQIVREGLARLIDREDDLEIIAEAENGLDAVQLAKKLQPDLIVLDLKMPVKDGATAATEILLDNPAAKILLLTSFTTNAEIKTALDSGVRSAIIKDCPGEMLIDALRRTAKGEKIVSQEIVDTISDRQKIPPLSSRQLDILCLVAKGFNNEEIAKRIGISRGGVKAHLAIAFNRLGAASRTEAVSLAISLGIIAP